MIRTRTGARTRVARAMLGALALGFVVAACGARGEANDAHAVSVAKSDAGTAGSTSRSLCHDGPTGELDAQQAEGTKIVEVCLVGGSAETRATLLRLLRLGPDKTLTASALRGDLEALYASGLVLQVEATARKYGTGAVLILSLQERPRLTGVMFDGLVALANAPVITSFPKAGDVFDPAAVFALGRKLRNEYVNGGWDDATVTQVAVPEQDGRVRLKIAVVEGVRAKVGKVTFEGASGGREVPLRQAVELAPGAAFGEPKLERAVLLVSAFYYDNGFMDVRVEPPVRARAADGTAGITFRITEGQVYRIGKVRVSKVDAATEKELLARMKTKPGEIFRRSKVLADLDAIRATYRARGKSVSAEPETELDAKKGIVDVVIAISDAP